MPPQQALKGLPSSWSLQRALPPVQLGRMPQATMANTQSSQSSESGITASLHCDKAHHVAQPSHRTAEDSATQGVLMSDNKPPHASGNKHTAEASPVISLPRPDNGHLIVWMKKCLI